MPSSQLETELLWHLRAAKVPIPEVQYKFHPTRLWKFDMAWPDKMIAVEVEGGIYGRKDKTGAWKPSHHGYGPQIELDCEKATEAAILGWRVLRLTEKAITSGRALLAIERALGIK